MKTTLHHGTLMGIKPDALMKRTMAEAELAFQIREGMTCRGFRWHVVDQHRSDEDPTRVVVQLEFGGTEVMALASAYVLKSPKGTRPERLRAAYRCVAGIRLALFIGAADALRSRGGAARGLNTRLFIKLAQRTKFKRGDGAYVFVWGKPPKLDPVTGRPVPIAEEAAQ